MNESCTRSKSAAARLGALAAGALALMAVSGTANAGTLIGSKTTNEHIDGETFSSTIALTGGTTIDGLTVTIDFTKCSDPLSSATCTELGNPYNNEIKFQLEHDGTTITLVDFYTYIVSPAFEGQRAIVTFDDTATDTVGTTNGGIPEDGTFKPEDAFTPFIGGTAEGDWTLIAMDAYQVDPLWLTSWSIEVFTPDPVITQPPSPPSPPSPGPSAVSEPGTLAFLGLGIIGLGLARRNRSIF